MIIYACVMGESVATQFLAGMPGIMIGLSLIAVVWCMADTYDLPPATRRATWGERGHASANAIWPLRTPVIIRGGILGGVFGPTEASAIAVGYATSIGLFVMKTLKLSDMPDILIRSGITAASLRHWSCYWRGPRWRSRRWPSCRFWASRWP